MINAPDVYDVIVGVLGAVASNVNVIPVVLDTFVAESVNNTVIPYVPSANVEEV